MTKIVISKRIAVFLMLLAAPVALLAQSSSIEAAFEKNKARYTRETFTLGEDATSGYDYFYYKSGPKIVNIRSIWSASYTRQLRIEDLYFDNGVLVLVRRSTADNRQLAALKRGGTAKTQSTEDLRFVNSKLVKWNEKGKAVPVTDPRWAETEKATLEHAKDEAESYAWLKKN